MAPGISHPELATTLLETLGQAALAAMESGSIVRLLLTADRTVVHANQAALAMVRRPGIFSITDNRLTLRRRDDEAAFEAMLVGARSGSMRLASRQGDVTHVVLIDILAGTAMVGVSVIDLRNPLAPQKRRWTCEALGLTAGSADLAEALANGVSLAEFAEQSGLTLGGVRTRLKKLLRQTGTRSQGEVVGMLARIAGHVSVR